MKRRFVPIALALWALSCGLDGGLKPLSSGIEGEATFSGPWPDSLVEVRVVAYADYPPASFTELIAWSDPLPIGQTAVHYSVDLPPGEYAMLVIAGRYIGAGWIPLADYNPDGDDEPEPVTLADRASVVRGVDFAIVFSSGAGISGKIVLATAWDDTVSSIRVGALANSMTNPPRPPPFTAADIGNVSAAYTIDDLSALGDTVAYSIFLPPGVYRTVGVTWMGYASGGAPESWSSAADIIKILARPVLGVYSSDPGSLQADSVVVEPGVMQEGIDVVVDFSRAGM